MGPPYNCVLVPGWGGTTLSYKGGKGGKTQLWYNPTALVANTPLAMGLANDGASPWPLIGKTLFPDGPVDWGNYQVMLDSLTAGGLNPVFWAYDWRLNPQTLAQQLATYLAGGMLASSFYMVCHSFGGLLARLAFPLFKAMNTGLTWSNTAYLGSPHGGSYWAPAALSGLFYDGSFARPIGQVFKLIASPRSVAGLILTGAQIAVGQMVGSWPSLYCLMPNPYGNWASLDPPASAYLQLATYEDTPGGQQQQWLTLASTVLTSLSNPATESGPPGFCVIGSAPSTLYRRVVGGSPSELASYMTTSLGDGTVPDERAQMPNQQTVAFKNTNHTALVNTLGPNANIVAWLKNPPTDQTLPNSTVQRLAPVIFEGVTYMSPPPNPYANRTGDP